MSNNIDLKSAFEYANERMREFQVGDFIEYSVIVDSEFCSTNEYLARVVEIQFGKIGFLGIITSAPRFVIEFIEDGRVKDIISFRKEDRFSYSFDGFGLRFARFPRFDDSWDVSAYQRITKLDNTEVKRYLLALKRQKEEKMRQAMEEKKQKEEIKKKNDAISKEELNALLKDFRNT